MWKIFVGFIAFALIALFVIMKAGDKVDMQGETHGSPAASHTESSAPATPAAPAAAAPAASEPAPAAAPAASAPAASK